MRHEPTWRSLFFRDFSETACPSCKAEFCRVPKDGCNICGLPGGGICRDCSEWEKTEFAGLVHSGKSLYVYNDAMKTYLHQYKFLQDVVLSEVFSGEINEALCKVDAILVPIPMNTEKLKQRTFSQVDELLASAGLPFTHLLSKTAQVQGKKSRQERLESTKLFEWNGKPIPDKIILIDDLYATGTTMRHAAKELKMAGAGEIKLFTLIRA